MNANEIDSIIFDLDGTLWDTTEICTDAWNQAISKWKKPYRKITVDDLKSIMGLTTEAIRDKLFYDLNLLEKDDLLKACFEEEINFLNQKSGILYPGVKEGLDILNKKYNLYLVSNCTEDYLQAFLTKTGLGKYFKDFECHGKTGLKKSKNISLVLERNFIQKAVYVGDTQTDEQAAIEAKIPFIFMTYGFGSSSQYLQSFNDFSNFVQDFRK